MADDPPPRPEGARWAEKAVIEELRRLRKADHLDTLTEELRKLAASQRRLHRLLEAVVSISAGTDTRAVLHHIVEAGIDLVDARYGALGVLGESGDFVDLITAGEGTEHIKTSYGLPRYHGLLGRLVAERRPLRVHDVTAHPQATGFPPGHPVMRTLLGVPLTVRDTVYGNLYVSEKRDGGPFTDDDEALLTALASAASVSIENSRLYGRLMRAAEHFQRRMLPTLPDLGPIEAQARYQPASDVLRLGGDWYDAIILPGGAPCVAVGDVTGHDVETAPLMGQIRHMLRALAYDQCGPPGRTVAKLDNVLDALGDPPTATLILGRLERIHGREYKFWWTNAGHIPPLLITPDGATRYLTTDSHGIPVGVDPSVPRPDHEHPLPAGSTLLLFTDGLVERRNQDIDVGLRALADHAARLATAPLDVLCDELIIACGQPFDDDVAVLALRLPREPGH